MKHRPQGSLGDSGCQDWREVEKINLQLRAQILFRFNKISGNFSSFQQLLRVNIIFTRNTNIHLEVKQQAACQLHTEEQKLMCTQGLRPTLRSH